MKLYVLSDLHNEFKPFEPPEIDYDVMVLAGDIHVGLRSALWALDNFRERPAVLVNGNHEYYGQKIPKLETQLQELLPETRIQYLNNAVYEQDGVRFLGAPLWTGFDLFGTERRMEAIDRAQQSMTDFKKIRLGESDNYRKLRAADTLAMHRTSLRFLRAQLAQPYDGKTVVVTHHAPSAKSLPTFLQNRLISAAYANDLESLMHDFSPDLWIHGHIHSSRDYTVGSTRVIANPRGYADAALNPHFDPELVIEI